MTTDTIPTRASCRHCGQTILQRSSDRAWFSQGIAVPVTSDCNDSPDGVHAPSTGRIAEQDARAAVERVRKLCDDMATHCGAERVDVPSWVARVRSALDGS